MSILSRRKFLQYSAGVTAGVLLNEDALAQFEILSFSGDIPIVQNFTNAKTAQFTILTEGAYPYSYAVVDDKGKSVSWNFTEQFYENGFFDFGVDKIYVTGLSPGRTYRLKVLSKSSGRVLDERKFQSLDIQQPRPFKAAVVSCACDTYSIQSAGMWNNLYKRKPDVIFLVGDTVYVDLGSSGSYWDMWRRYCETRLTLTAFRQPFLIPTLATWDDHDFGVNNGNIHFKQKDFTKRAFQLFWGSKDQSGFQQGVGVSSYVQMFGQNFCFMDDRYYRAVRGTGGLHWGSAQQEMLFEKLGKTNRPTWLLNGSQFFGGYLKQESFEADHASNFKDVLKKLSKQESPFLFVSGDVHFSEVMSIEERLLGYKSIEITSSSIHSFTFPGVNLPHNPRRITTTWHHNFVIVESTYDEKTKNWNLRSRAYGSRNQTLMSHSTTIHR